jgi:hypothetical protein
MILSSFNSKPSADNTSNHARRAAAAHRLYYTATPPPCRPRATAVCSARIAQQLTPTSTPASGSRSSSCSNSQATSRISSNSRRPAISSRNSGAPRRIAPVMVEGHQCHRVGHAHRRLLLGKAFEATSPNGRFVEGEKQHVVCSRRVHAS